MRNRDVVLVTGATGAVGRALSESLAGRGYRIAVTARSSDKLEQAAGGVNIPSERILALPADLTRADQVGQLVNRISAEWGGVDMLVNPAGGWVGGTPLADLSEDEWDRALDRNLRTAFLVNQAVLPHMTEQQWGRIVNFASKAADTPSSRQAGYNVAKAGVVALTQSIAAEYRRKGIRANVILPSIIDTTANRKAMPDADHSRWVTIGSIAGLVLHLLSDQGQAISGAALPLYGAV
jgi:NAD(P)-dependent dehydrogenase (short-subunit alcohol dehydrogenase family)